jgi:hypothetical protein
MFELIVILKDSERTHRHKFVIYEEVYVNPDDPIIISCIEEAKKNFEGEPESIQIKINLEVQ